MHIPTIDDVRQAANVMHSTCRQLVIRSHALEKELGLPEHQRVAQGLRVDAGRFV